MNASAPMIRLTTQRRVILDELTCADNHPTVMDLYDKVCKRMPTIGLSTLYRNLELMAEYGMILKYELVGTQKRFDAVTTPHYHVRCSSCGKVEDLDIMVSADLDARATQRSSYKILGHFVEYVGICPDCRQQGKTKVILYREMS